MAAVAPHLDLTVTAAAVVHLTAVRAAEINSFLGGCGLLDHRYHLYRSWHRLPLTKAQYTSMANMRHARSRRFRPCVSISATINNVKARR